MKYVIYNDIDYIFKNKKKLISLLFILSIISILILIQSRDTIFDILTVGLGLNLKLKESGTMEIIMYLLNLFFFLYLIVDIYIKDITYNIDNIFLRIKPLKYIIYKNIGFILITFLIKMLQYILCILLGIIMNKEFSMNIIDLYFTDYIYILIFQYLFMILYYIYIIMKKNVYVLLIGSLVMIGLIPKNIWKMNSNLGYILIIFLLIQIIIYVLFSKKNKSIIENL